MAVTSINFSKLLLLPLIILGGCLGKFDWYFATLLLLFVSDIKVKFKSNK